jgi:hypothetical protein
MDGDAFKRALAKLGHTQSGFAREHNLHVRTVQNWTRVGPPDFVVPLLNAMVQQTIEAPATQIWTSNEAASTEAAQVLDHSLRSVLLRASRAGWPQDVILAGMMTWLAGQVIGRR